MKIEQAIAGVKLLFLDTAPVIYYLEGHPTFSPLMRSIFDRVTKGDLQIVSSPITLAECSSISSIQKQPELKQDLTDVLALDRDGIFRITDEVVLIEAVKMRVKYGLKLADAIQVATAIVCNCDGFLTNDLELNRVTEIGSIVVSELEL